MNSFQLRGVVTPFLNVIYSTLKFIVSISFLKFFHIESHGVSSNALILSIQWNLDKQMCDFLMHVWFSSQIVWMITIRLRQVVEHFNPWSPIPSIHKIRNLQGVMQIDTTIMQLDYFSIEVAKHKHTYIDFQDLI